MEPTGSRNSPILWNAKVQEIPLFYETQRSKKFPYFMKRKGSRNSPILWNAKVQEIPLFYGTQRFKKFPYFMEPKVSRNSPILWNPKVQEIPLFYGTQRFITAFTSAHHLSLSWVSSIQSIPPHPTSWRAILILSSHLRLGLPSGLFPSGFPTKTLYTPVLSSIRATCPAHFPPLSLYIYI